MPKSRVEEPSRKATARYDQNISRLHPPNSVNDLVSTDPAPELRELQALVRSLEALREMRTAEVNRLPSGIAVGAARESVEELVARPEEQTRRTGGLIGGHINKHPGLKRQRDLLGTNPGAGGTTAAALLAEVPGIKRYRSARQAAARAGPAPRQRQSGGSARGRALLPKTGGSGVRKALHFPAVTAPRRSRFLGSRAEGVRRSGESEVAAIGAAVRKLAHLACGVSKDGPALRRGAGESRLATDTVSQRRAPAQRP